MAANLKEAWSDRECLEMLFMRDHLHIKNSKIAEVMGCSRSAVIGLLSRIDKHTDKYDASPDLNGTMPPRWWVRETGKET